MAKVLVLYAHPAPHKSQLNRHLIAAARATEGVTVRDLYELYPDFYIDVAAEQQALLEHDVIVLQHPFYWYSSPALLKEWQDLVLTYGWAYGEGGNALRGKTMLSAITTGGPLEAYQATGRNRYTIRQLLAPFDQTAYLCGMRYLAPHVIHSAHQQDPANVAQNYARLLTLLRDEALPLDAAATAQSIQEVMESSVISPQSSVLSPQS